MAEKGVEEQVLAMERLHFTIQYPVKFTTVQEFKLSNQF